MKTILIALSLVLLSTLPVLASPDKAPETFSLPKLDYAYNALEPVIDATTMETHYTKHHQAYIDKLNGEVAKDERLKGLTLEEIISKVSTYNDTVRNNAGGHWNHRFFWTIMAPADKTGTASPALTTAINESFGSLDKFKAAFEKAGTDRFGSGWVWLIVTPDGKLAIISTPNQDNPLMDDAKMKGTPILGNDVWEHAYYLTYKNKRADYLKNWWSVVNWGQVSANFDAAGK